MTGHWGAVWMYCPLWITDITAAHTSTTEICKAKTKGSSMQTFKHGWKKEMDTWAGLVQEQIREQLLQQMEMSSDYQQVGSSKPEAVAFSSVQRVSDMSRGHVLLIPIVLRRDAHTIFTEVEGKYRYLRVSDWCGVLIKHASTENTHTPWNYPWGFSWDSTYKNPMQNPCWIYHYNFFICVFCLKEQ